MQGLKGGSLHMDGQLNIQNISHCEAFIDLMHLCHAEYEIQNVYYCMRVYFITILSSPSLHKALVLFPCFLHFLSMFLERVQKNWSTGLQRSFMLCRCFRPHGGRIHSGRINKGPTLVSANRAPKRQRVLDYLGFKLDHHFAATGVMC